MKKLSILLTFLLISCQPPNYNPSDLHKWINDYMAGIRTTDIELLLSLFTSDIKYLPPNQAALSGKEALSRWFLSYFNYYDNISERLWVKDVQVAGDFAYVTCNYSFLGTLDNKEVKDFGKIIYLFKHKHLGKWVCTHAMWNNDNRSFDMHSEIPADFSGHWKLDLSRSTNAPSINSSTLFITQKQNKININRFYEMKNKETLENSVSYTIGKEIKTTRNTDSFSTECYWSSDKQSFITIESISSEKIGTQKYVRKTIYSIIAKGEILNIISDDMIPEGSLIPIKERHIEMVYFKL